MPKEPEQREVDETASFDDGFDKEGIKKSAELDIKPNLQLPEANESIKVTFASEPRKVISAKLPNGSAWFIDIFYEDGEYSIVIPNSLRYSLNTMMARNNWKELVNKTVIISAQIGQMKNYPKAKTYKAVEGNN